MVELADSPESWPLVKTSDLHRDHWVVALRSDTIRHPDDSDERVFRRVVLEHPGAAIVLAVDDDQQVVLLRQYRHAGGKRFVEVPAGLIDHPGEDPLDVAERELAEEVGLAAGRWTHLTSAWPSPGISSEVQHLYLAQDLTEVGRGDFEVEHEEADMEVFRAPWSDVVAAVLAGDIGDLPMVAAVLLAHARGLVPGVGPAVGGAE